ncbi:MAG TPA: tetratricopeptide repeat protein [Phycisphaerales bacterium]|nr:tetratricopeptide repeat protein [Phycisphaerales bacterium]
MASTSNNPDVPAAAPAPRWRDVWQVPLLAGSVAVLAAGAVWSFATKPKPDVMGDFRRAEQQMESHEYADALDTLSTRVLPVLAEGGLSPELEKGFYLMRARAVYLGQKEKGISREENFRSVVEEYGRAEKLGQELENQDQAYLAWSLLKTDELNKAAERTLALPAAMHDDRIELLKELIEVSLEPNRGENGQARALDLLTELTRDTELTNEDRLWALSRQAKLMVAQGYYEDAMTRILRTMPRISSEASPTLRGEVLVTLAQAYIGQGDLESAISQLQSAVEAVGEGSEVAAQAYALAGQAFLELDQLEPAQGAFTMVLTQYGVTEWRQDATLGAAEVQARIARREGDHEAIEPAIEMYDQLVSEITGGHDEVHVSPDRVGESLMARYQEQSQSGEHRTALRFISLAERLYKADDAPAEMLLGLAEVRKKLADEMLESLGKGGAMSLTQADPATQREARELLLAAGSYYAAHAGRVAVLDTGLYAQSLWNAADAYDRAGDTEEAVRQFQQFVGDFPSDTRQPEAKYRLGEAYRARGEYKLAVQVFSDLVAEGSKAGPFADQSYVPLAQTMLSDDDTSNDEQAEGLLREVVSGRLGGTSSPAYRRALLELGDLCYRTQRYEQAVERYEEFLDRASIDTRKQRDRALDLGEAVSVPGVRFKLADAYRLSSRNIEKSLRAAMPETEARDLQRTSRDRLAKAADNYEQCAAELDAQSHRTELEDLYLRNALFYVADCAFDLKDFDTAVRRYEAARERYPRDPAALVAMTQVVAAYMEQGLVQKAEVANTKAKKFYESLPESVWDDPMLPMSRREWERWLDAQGRLATAVAQENEGG